MMAADDFVQFVAHAIQKVLVGVQDVAGRREFDDRLGAGDRRDLAVVFRSLHRRRGDVGGDLDDPAHLAAHDDRIVGGLDPDFATALGDPLESTGFKIPGAEPLPEFAILPRSRIGRFAEQAVVLADDFGQLVADGTTEVFVGGQDMAGHVELDDGLGLGKGSQDSTAVQAERKKRHGMLRWKRMCLRMPLGQTSKPPSWR